MSFDGIREGIQAWVDPLEVGMHILCDIKMSECHLTRSNFSATSLTLHKTLIDDFIPHKNIITSFKESL